MKEIHVEMFKKIQARLDEQDGIVQVSTCMRSTVFEHKHRDMFRLSKDGKSLLVQRGRNWDCIADDAAGSYVSVRFGWMK